MLDLFLFSFHIGSMDQTIFHSIFDQLLLISVNLELMKNLWIPNIFIYNLKSFKTIDVLSKLAGLWIDSKKRIYYSQATHITFICKSFQSRRLKRGGLVSQRFLDILSRGKIENLLYLYLLSSIKNLITLSYVYTP